MQRDDTVTINHILDAARKALQFVENRQREDLDKNEMLALSLVHLLEIIGEAANAGLPFPNPPQRQSQFPRISPQVIP